MPVEKGDFVIVDYIALTKEDGEEKVFDTTIEEEAKKAELSLESFGPILVVIGEGRLLSNVEEALIGVEEGEWKIIELPPEKAFGKRDKSKIITVSARELSRQGIVPRPGESITFEYKRKRYMGRIIHVGGGRVIVDTNHPLAGKNVVYKVKVVKIIKDLNGKIDALLHRWFGDIEGYDVKIDDGRVTVTLPEDLLVVEKLGIFVRGLARDIEEHLPDVKEFSVTFKFAFERAEEKKEEEPQQEKAVASEGT
mgnify:FL=1